MWKTTKPIFAATLFVSGLAIGTLSANFDTSAPTTLERAVSNVVQQVSPQSNLANFNELAKVLKPSVVNISVVREQGHFQADGQGSGLILTADGEILTNAHVVRGASDIVVKLHDGRELEARVLGTDTNTDLALLKLQNVEDLQPVKLGNSDKLEVGEWVMAIGNPYGLEATVTVGVLSAKGRVIGAGPYDDFLQTDTSINPGNSGGPLFNIHGEVVGINTAILKQGQGIGFSIPVNLAKEIADDLRLDGRVSRGYLGVGITPLTPALKKSLGILPETDGAVVTSVIPQGPAARAGLKAGDVVTHLEGSVVSSDRDLLRQVAKFEKGRNVSITLIRNGKEKELNATLAERPSNDQVRKNRAPRILPGKKYRVGVGVTDIPTDSGAMITQILPGSAAQRAGLRPGDIIRKVGTEYIESAKHFAQAAKGNPDGDLAILVERNGREMLITVD